MSKKIIIWDWNGTLLNDVEICISAMNNMLNKRGLGKLTVDKYKDIFTFPVKDYYEIAGFDFKKYSFDDLAVEFISQYYDTLPKASLFNKVDHVLNTMKQNNIMQVIISAMEHNALVKSLKHFKIFHYFDEVIGIEDHLANGKMHNVEKFVKSHNTQDSEIVMIGDTLHDCEIGNKLNIDVLLVASGHQSYDRLKQCHSNVYHNLSELVPSILS